MIKNFPLVFLSLMVAVGLFSCKKTYVCNCYTHHKFQQPGPRPHNTYELYEYDRKTAKYKCKSRNNFNAVTLMETECGLAL